MKFSIKSPNAILWKIGYSLEQVMELHKSRQITEDWMICPLGEAPRAVTITEFNRNPAIFEKAVDVNGLPEKSENVSSEKESLSVAQMGWAVFFSSLLVYFILTILARESISVFAGNLGSANALHAFIIILVKGVEALIIAGAIVALLGHAYEKVTKAK